MPYFVLIMDNQAASGEALAKSLKPDFESASCTRAAQVLERIHSTRPPDLLIADGEPSDMQGQTFLQAVRDSEVGSGLPIILMGSRKSEEAVLAAFRLGIDDWVEKPFDLREMAVRAKAVLRRRYERLETTGVALKVGCVEIDPSQRLCQSAGKRVNLQPREFELLEILMRKAGRVLTRQYLLDTVWGMSTKARTRAVDMMVSRLRGKLGARGSRLIETVSKLGYCFRA
jgi:DNA-binding response OmpR family regulator